MKFITYWTIHLYKKLSHRIHHPSASAAPHWVQMAHIIPLQNWRISCGEGNPCENVVVTAWFRSDKTDKKMDEFLKPFLTGKSSNGRRMGSSTITMPLGEYCEHEFIFKRTDIKRDPRISGWKIIINEKKKNEKHIILGYNIAAKNLRNGQSVEEIDHIIINGTPGNFNIEPVKEKFHSLGMQKGKSRSTVVGFYSPKGSAANIAYVAASAAASAAAEAEKKEFLQDLFPEFTQSESSESAPSESVPSESAPSESVPSESASSESVPSDAVSPPDAVSLHDETH